MDMGKLQIDIGMDVGMDIATIQNEVVTKMAKLFVDTMLETGVHFLPTDNQLLLLHLHHIIITGKPKLAFTLEVVDFFASFPVFHSVRGWEVDGAWYFYMPMDIGRFPYYKGHKRDESPGKWTLKATVTLKDGNSVIGTKRTRVWLDEKDNTTDWAVDEYIASYRPEAPITSLAETVFPNSRRNDNTMLIKLYKKKTS